MARLLVVRHGETLWNSQTRYQGQQDSPLLAVGVAQADALGRRLQREPIDLVIASDLGRTMATAAAIVAHTGHAVVTNPGLRERDYGAFEGLTRREAQAQHPEAWQRDRDRDLDARAGGAGESLEVFAQRCHSTVTEIATRHPSANVLIVTHGGVLDCLYRRAASVPMTATRTWALANCSLNVIDVVGDAWSLLSWGDVAHLDEAADDATVR